MVLSISSYSQNERNSPRVDVSIVLREAGARNCLLFLQPIYFERSPGSSVCFIVCFVCLFIKFGLGFLITALHSVPFTALASAPLTSFRAVLVCHL